MMRFRDSIAANLRYWHARVRPLQDREYVTLDPDREGLARAVAYGLNLLETWEAAARLELALMDYIESRGLWRNWIPLFARALDACPPDNLLLHGKLACRLGFLYRLDGQLEPALVLHQQAAADAEQVGDLAEKSMAHLGIADEYFLMKNYTPAERHARAALEVFTQAGETGPRLRAAFNLLGMNAQERGAYLEAEKYYREALAEPHGADPPRKRGQVLMNLAYPLRDLGRYPEARAVLEEALTLLLQTKSTLLWNQAQLALGTIHFAQQAWDAAEAAFRALDTRYLQRFGHTLLLAQQANNLGNVYLKQHAYPAAAEQLAYAAQLFRELGDDVNLGNTLGDLGEACLRQGDAAQARQLWEESLALLTKYPQNAWARKRYQDVLAQRDQLGADFRSLHPMAPE